LLFLGSRSGLTEVPVWSVRGDAPRTLFGESVSGAGDVDGDAFDDVIVGEKSWSEERINGGRALVYRGSSAGLAREPSWVAAGGQSDGLFGDTVASAGDVNADGFADLLVGASSHSDDFDREGRADLFLGSAGGPSDTPDWSAFGGESNARLGGSAGGAGDVNGDGAADVIVGARQAGVFRGEARVYLGNGGGGRSLTPRQLRVGSRAPVAVRGRSDAPDGVRLTAIAGSPAGRADVALEWQVAPSGAAFDDEALQREPLRDSRAPGKVGSRVVLTAEVNDLDAGRFYHWRVRYASPSPYFPRSIWRSTPRTSPLATAFRTDGELPDATSSVIGPAANERVYPDSEPLVFSWYRGGGTRFRVDWSGNPDFEPAMSSPEASTASPSDIQVFVPATELWHEILGLAAGNPDVRDIPVFWRLVALDPESGDTEEPPLQVIRVAAAQAPTLVSPPDGSEVLAIQPPTLIWNANHNDRFRIVFSASDSLAEPHASSGEGFDVTGESWVPADKTWAAAVELARSHDGIVYYSVFARDGLGRLTWSRVRGLRVIGDPLPRR
jgi:hypothetical protein